MEFKLKQREIKDQINQILIDQEQHMHPLNSDSQSETDSDIEIEED